MHTACLAYNETGFFVNTFDVKHFIELIKRYYIPA